MGQKTNDSIDAEVDEKHTPLLGWNVLLIAEVQQEGSVCGTREQDRDQRANESERGRSGDYRKQEQPEVGARNTIRPADQNVRQTQLESERDYAAHTGREEGDLRL